MTPSNRKTILELVQLSDIGLLFSCLGIAYLLTSQRKTLDLLNSLETHHPIQVFLGTIALGFAWHGVLQSKGFYRSRRLESYLTGALDFCSAALLCALLSFVWLWAVSSPLHRNVERLGIVSAVFGLLCFLN